MLYSATSVTLLDIGLVPSRLRVTRTGEAPLAPLKRDGDDWEIVRLDITVFP